MSESRRGEKHPMWGKPKSEEMRRKLSESQPNQRGIIQYTKDGVFIRNWDSARQAGRELKIAGSNITRCCRKRYNLAYNCIWRYADDPLIEEQSTQLRLDFE
jgi:hypothetical protein